jgi:hypothetical protein
MRSEPQPAVVPRSAVIDASVAIGRACVELIDAGFRAEGLAAEHALDTISVVAVAGNGDEVTRAVACAAGDEVLTVLLPLVVWADEQADLPVSEALWEACDLLMVL